MMVLVYIVKIEDELIKAELREAITNQNNFIDKDAYIKLILMRNMVMRW